MFLRWTYLVAIAVVLAPFVSACVPKGSPPLQPSSQGELKTEPTPAADFLSAFRRGDEATAEHQASPLYHLEWARRNITVKEREAWLPAAYRAGKAGPAWLNVTYVDGFVDADGKGHLLYVGRSPEDSGSASASVWRLDTDEAGRVTWAEMVWLFSDATKGIASVSASSSDPTSAIPPTFDRMQPRFIFGVHSASDWEGYYAVWHTAGDHLALNFFAIDETGDLRPGVWTYQQR